MLPWLSWPTAFISRSNGATASRIAKLPLGQDFQGDQLSSLVCRAL